MPDPPTSSNAQVDLRSLLEEGRPELWSALAAQARRVETFHEALRLSTLSKRAVARGIRHETRDPPLRVAVVGGFTLQPLCELFALFLRAEGIVPELFVGNFDDYVAEILDPTSALHSFRPEVVVILPSERRCVLDGNLSTPLSEQRAQVERAADALLALCDEAHAKMDAAVVLANFVLPEMFDLGGLRVQSLASDYSFRKAVNLELGLRARPHTVICDLEFLGARFGGLRARDHRRWFESKQPFSPDFVVAVARELALSVRSHRASPKKLLVLDLDNTLWGGVIGDDGVEGIELGDTSPRGEAFKAFQSYVRSLKDRGVLLAVCSKNDYERAVEPFLKHPEMVLELNDFVSFKANWEPKSENIRAMATELALGTDSFVFVDDNPAEIEIVRQFAPEVATILVGPDPGDYVSQLASSRYFEPRAVTAEDRVRSLQYQQEAERQALRATVTDLATYLASLEMRARVLPFRTEDVPRIAQLVNKSNQFNLTTRRLSESEVAQLAASPQHGCFTVRLADRFGDHGLIAVVIGEKSGERLDVHTWLMSCRVLKRQVEELTLGEIVRVAKRLGCSTIRGEYLPTKKNSMVRDLYPRLGFTLMASSPEALTFEAHVDSLRVAETAIALLDETPKGEEK